MRRNTKVLPVYVELQQGRSLREFLDASREDEIVISNLQMEPGSAEAGICFIASAKTRRKLKKEKLLQKLKEISLVQYVEEL